MTDAALATAARTAPATPVASAPGGGPLSAAAWRRRLRSALLGLVAFGLLCLAWELYKLVGSPDGTQIAGVSVLPRNTDVAMPHTWDVLARLGDPETGARGSRTVGEAVLAGVWFTVRVALVGLVAGVVVGMLLAVAMQQLRLVERGLLPYVIASQTVPLVALAPLVAGWGGKLEVGNLDWQPWMSVALIATYLSFFPVSVGMLRGLQSPPDAAVELMRSYDASRWQTLLRLRLPASVPFLVPALKLAGAAAVVGAVVAEISTGTRGGVGRLIISYAQSATSNAEKLYAAVLGAAAAGLVVAGLIALVELALTWGRGVGGRTT